MAVLIDFRWHVHENGYQFEDDRLVLSNPTGAMREIWPLSIAKLYDEFAALELTQPAIVEFANKYGSLDWIVSGKTGIDTFSTWCEAIDFMEVANFLYSHLDDLDALRRRIEWIPGGVTVYTKRGLIKYDFSHYAERATRLQLHTVAPGDVQRMARRLLLVFITQYLYNAVATSMADAEWQEFSLAHQPKNLLGSLWLQFAWDIDQKIQYRNCLYCGKPFAVSRSEKIPRQYCSPAHRAAASRAGIAARAIEAREKLNKE